MNHKLLSFIITFGFLSFFTNSFSMRKRRESRDDFFGRLSKGGARPRRSVRPRMHSSPLPGLRCVERIKRCRGSASRLPAIRPRARSERVVRVVSTKRNVDRWIKNINKKIKTLERLERVLGSSDKRSFSFDVRRKDILLGRDSSGGLLSDRDQFQYYLPELQNLYDDVCEGIKAAELRISRERSAQESSKAEQEYDLLAETKKLEKKRVLKIFSHMKKILIPIAAEIEILQGILGKMVMPKKNLLRFYGDQKKLQKSLEISQEISIKRYEQKLLDVLTEREAMLQLGQRLTLPDAERLLLRAKDVLQNVKTSGEFIREKSVWLKKELVRVQDLKAKIERERQASPRGISWRKRKRP